MTRTLNFAGICVMSASLLAVACPQVATARPSVVATGERAYEVIPPPDANAPRQSYIIVPGDVLNLQVFQEPELSSPELQVDNVGNIQLPLIGEVPAAGLSATQLAKEVEDRLGRRYVVNPQVVVTIKKAAARFVAVEGQVKQPGVYEIDREYSLLEAIAKAQSPTNIAKLSDVVVFRNIDGQRMGARFNLRAIRAGEAPDPQIHGGDVIVVGFSAIKSAWRDVLQAAPLFNIFYRRGI